jgi:hypothetical protein
MELENFRWWHWLLISIPLGWLMAYANSAPIQPTDLRTDRETTFESAALHAPVGPSLIPWMRNIIVYPPTPAIAAGGGTTLITPVTYEVLEPKPGGQPGEYEYKPTWFGARVPYAPTNRRPTDGNGRVLNYPPGQLPPGIEKLYAPDDDATLQSITKAVYGVDSLAGQQIISMANPALEVSQSVAALIKANRLREGQSLLIPWNPSEGRTVRDWFDAAGHDYNWVHYRFAWWKVDRYCKMLWMGISVGIVGVLFPALTSILAGAGLGGRRAVKSDYDLNRFGTGTAAARMPAKAKELDEQGREQLAAMNASLMSSLKEGAVDGSKQPGTSPPAAAPAAAAAKAKPLPTEAAPAIPAPEQPAVKKEYAGEFYPVVRPVESHADDPKKPPSPKPPDERKKP